MFWWWSWTESNRRPSACKADALPIELQPHPHDSSSGVAVRPGFAPDKVVGLERLELSTSRLSGVRSNHLSYRPETYSLNSQRAKSLIESEQRVGS